MFEKLINPSDRRTFLKRAALTLPAMHGVDVLATAARAQTASDAPPGPRANLPVDLVEYELRTNRVAEQLKFYEELFRRDIVLEDGESVTVEFGRTRIRFVHSNEEKPFLYHFAFNIPENQLELARRWVLDRWPLLRHRQTGEQVVHFRRSNAHSIYWFDPSGNLVEFIARHNLPTARDGAFDESCVIQASEIGVVTPSVPRTAEELERRLGTPVRERNRGSETFAAVGDEHGRFIVVNLGRQWLMTDIPSAQFGTHVRIRGTQPGIVTLDDVPGLTIEVI